MSRRSGPASTEAAGRREPAGFEQSDPVLFVTPRWSRDGGVGAHVAASAAALAEAGVQVTVLCARNDGEARLDGVDIVESPTLFDASADPRERTATALERGASVIHLHQVEDPGLLAWLHERAPVVVSAHGYTACTSGVHYFRPGHECMRPHGPGCVPRLPGCAHTTNPSRLPGSYRSASLGLRSLRECDLAISYSTAIDRHLEINGVKRRAVVPYFSTLRAASGSGHEHRRRVVFVGRVVAPKGVGVLIRAARAVDAEFVVCGDGWRLEEMRKLAARIGVADRFRFTGWLEPGELAGEIAEASVVAIPSVWPEPFGLGGIEAFEAGRPVVASLTGGTGDWLQDGINGLAVRPGDVDQLAGALSELLADPQRQRAMGEAGRAMTAQKFTPRSHLQALQAAYQRAQASWQG